MRALCIVGSTAQVRQGGNLKVYVARFLQLNFKSIFDCKCIFCKEMCYLNQYLCLTYRITVSSFLLRTFVVSLNARTLQESPGVDQFILRTIGYTYHRVHS